MFTASVIGSPVVYPTIQAAVNAAPAGGTVRVSAGTYDELVTVNKPLTLLGAQAGVDARSFARGRNETVVDGQNFGGGNRSSAFDVTANDVTLDGFTVQGQTSSNVYGAGIVLAPLVAGTHVTDDVVQDNVVGLYLANGSAADPAVIRHDVFAYNNNPGNNNGRGIYSDGGVSGGNLTGVVIDADTFVGNVGDGTSGNPEAAVGLEAQTAGKQSDIAITNNVMANNGKGLLVYNATDVTFSGNLVTGSTDAGSAAVRDEGDVSNLVIDDNVVLGGAGAAVRVTARFVGPSANVTVNLNAFAGNAGGGVVVDPGGETGTLDARFNYWGPGTGQAVGAVDASSPRAVPPPLPGTFAADNGPWATLAADLTILSYAIAERNGLLLALLV